jgi:hypothetical protein
MEEKKTEPVLPLYKVVVSYKDGTNAAHIVSALSGIEASNKVPLDKGKNVNCLSVVGIKNKATLIKAQPKMARSEREKVRVAVAKIKQESERKLPRDREERKQVRPSRRDRRERSS